MITVNFLVIGGKKDPRKDINLLVVTNHFTRYAQAYVTMSQTTATVVKVLFERFFTQYGWPAKLLTDQGPQFKGRLFQQLMHEAQIRKIRTTPYHPEGNAQCERFNKTLLGMLGTMPIESKKGWQEWVLALTHAYYCTISKTTGFAPFFLMFGHEPEISIDRELNLPGRREEGGAQTYVDRLKQKLEWAFTKVQENIQRDMRAQKKYHDKALRCHKVEVGDLVMLRDKKLGTNYKIVDKWDDNLYEVVSEREDGPVFAIQQIGSKKGEIQVVHHNMIHPVRSVDREDEQNTTESQRVLALVKANTLMDILFSV